MADPAEAAGLVPFGRYVIRARMAAGGMGEVFRGVAVGADGFEKPIAIKRLRPELARRPEIASRLAQEAKLMTRLNHPNVVQVLDFGRAESGDAFLVMELVEGLDLGAFCAALEQRGQRVEARCALFVLQQLLRGLAYAHATLSAEGQRLVHRDISPGNVLLSSFGEVKVADFGVALLVTPAIGSDGLLAGKPDYMAPEQRAQGAVDERADLYGAGAVLFRMLVGRAPQLGELEADEAVLAAEVREGLTPALRSFVQRALAPEPTRRFADAQQMSQALLALGHTLAGADGLAEQVQALVLAAGARERPVLVLGAARENLGAGTELTHAVTGSGFTVTLPARAQRVHWRMPALLVALVLLGVLLGVRVRLGLRSGSGESAARATRPRAPAASAPAPEAASPPATPAEAPASPLETAPAPPSSERSRPRARGRSAGSTPVSHAECRGQVHVFAAFGWLVYGGPQNVQAPGRYEWPCGRYRLRAVSRVNAAEVRQLDTEVRAGAVAVIDLR